MPADGNIRRMRGGAVQAAGGALIVAGIALVRIDSLASGRRNGSEDLLAVALDEAAIPDAPGVTPSRAR